MQPREKQIVIYYQQLQFAAYKVISECTYMMESVAVRNLDVEKYILLSLAALNIDSLSNNDSGEYGSDAELQDIKINEVIKPVLDQLNEALNEEHYKNDSDGDGSDGELHVIKIDEIIKLVLDQAIKLLNQEPSKNDSDEEGSGSGPEDIKIDELIKPVLDQLIKPLNEEPSKNELVEDGSDSWPQDIKIDEKAVLDQTSNQETNTGDNEFQENKEQFADFNGLSSNNTDKNDIESIQQSSEDEEQDCNTFFSDKLLTIYGSRNNNAEETLINPSTISFLCEVLNENPNNMKVQKSVIINGEKFVSELKIDTEVIVELLSYASKQEQIQEKVIDEHAPHPEDGGNAINLDTINVPEKEPRRNFHPLFIAADGQVHELLVKHRKVMRLTKPSPYQRIQKCMGLRKYFGGLPHNYECNKHNGENRSPLWMQKYLYEYRHFLTNVQHDEDEQYSLKRLLKPRKEKESKSKEKGKKQPRLANICRLCGRKTERFVSLGNNVVIKLVSVYLPLVIIEGNRFPLGLCDKCDYSLSLICSFMLTYLDCGKLERNEKKCFTCRCAIENLLTPANGLTMYNLAIAFHGIRYDLRKFLGRGQKYLCNACRLSFELLQSLREQIWLTNKVFEDGDERLYETEGEVYKNQFTCDCEVPPGFYPPPKIDRKFRNSVDNCSVDPVTDSESNYKDDYEPRKFSLKTSHPQRRRVTKFVSRLFGSRYDTDSKTLQQPQGSAKEPEESQQRGIISALKRGVTLSFQPLRKLFRRATKENLNTKCPENQKYNEYELLPTPSNESTIEDNSTSSSSSSDAVEEARTPILKELVEQWENSQKSDGQELSLLNFFLGNMDTSLFAYFNATLPPDTAEFLQNTEETSTSEIHEVQVVADV